MDNKEKLLKYAIYYLSKYSSSKKNLEYILKKKIRRLSEEKKIRFNLYQEIRPIIKELENKKIIDDKKFAESKIQSLLNKGKSKNYIRQYLINKGIQLKLTDNTISSFYAENKNIETENALKFAIKKNLLTNDDNYEKKLLKMARAGFSYEISKKIIK